MQAAGFSPHIPSLQVILPVGISFYTFQTMSYTIDVYRGKIGCTRDVLAFFAFVSFFPQLVAGPIERAAHLLPQFERRRQFDTHGAKDGLRQILWGFFKKVVVADVAAYHVNRIFDSYETLGGLTLILGAYLFAMQIYCDFSGYSDIAIGVSRLLGFDLMRNFAYPYFARNIAEFWHRWHISLSTWFRDYVYFSLGGSRVGRFRQISNVMATFVLSGLWHGANWTFVVWGALNGLYYVPLIFFGGGADYSERDRENHLLPTPREAVAMLTTFGLTLIAWVFFRSPTLGDAFGFLHQVVNQSFMSESLTQIRPMADILLLSLAFMAVEWVQRNKQHALAIERLPWAIRWAIYYTVIALIALKGDMSDAPFIYFQF